MILSIRFYSICILLTATILVSVMTISISSKASTLKMVHNRKEDFRRNFILLIAGWFAYVFLEIILETILKYFF